MDLSPYLWIFSALAVFLHVLGFVCALEAVMTARSSQGAFAWAISLISLPYLALPCYVVFGRRRFHGYVKARRAGNLELHRMSAPLAESGVSVAARLKGDEARFSVLEQLVQMPFTAQNQLRLLIDGPEAFPVIFKDIAEATEYVVIQFFIIKDDELGREFKALLKKKVAEGVAIYLLYDEIGSHALPSSYMNELRDAGVMVSSFHTWGKRNRFQINFRNHRKVVVVDGVRAYFGGMNIGDEYMGKNPHFGRWRDTFVAIEGPAVQCVQLSFLEDWYWATHSVPDLEWEPTPAKKGDMKALVLPTGPADQLETCGLFFIHAIHSAKNRIWITSPYFVPDLAVISALQLAALRGVDVRIMIPQKVDHILVYLSAFSYLKETESFGVKIYRYQSGFLHQKVMLIDDDMAAVGTANLDNRSFRLNFEIMTVVADRSFNRSVEAMLEADFEECRLEKATAFEERSFWFRVAVRFSRLLAPIQ